MKINDWWEEILFWNLTGRCESNRGCCINNLLNYLQKLLFSVMVIRNINFQKCFMTFRYCPSLFTLALNSKTYNYHLGSLFVFPLRHAQGLLFDTLAISFLKGSTSTTFLLVLGNAIGNLKSFILIIFERYKKSVIKLSEAYCLLSF